MGLLFLLLIVVRNVSVVICRGGSFCEHLLLKRERECSLELGRRFTYKKNMQPMSLEWGGRIIGMASKKRQLSLVSPWQQEPRDTDALGPMEMLGPSEMPTALAKRRRLDDTSAMEVSSASRSAPAEPPLQFHQSLQSQQ